MGAILGTTILVSPNEKSFIDMLQHVSEILNRKESNKAGRYGQKDETKILLRLSVLLRVVSQVQLPKVKFKFKKYFDTVLPYSTAKPACNYRTWILLRPRMQAVPRGLRTVLTRPPRDARPCARIRYAHTGASTSNDPSSSSQSNTTSSNSTSTTTHHRSRRFKRGARTGRIRLCRVEL
jgi:hypothetical protein